MRKAIIDLGTNTFNLLIGSIKERDLVVTFATKEAVMLGMGGINHGVIAEDAMARARVTLMRFKEKCDQEGVSYITGVGTSAMRGAKNADELISWAKDVLSMPIHIVSGDEEADLIYKGVLLLHQFEEPEMIMDIGGGSNEFIVADASGVVEAKSFNIGVSRIYQLLDEPEEFSPEVRSRVANYFEEETKGFFTNKNIPNLIGASGSFETLYEMLYEVRFPSDPRMQELPINDVYRLIGWSMNSTLEERLANEWIVPMRKKMLPIAAYSILWVMEKLNTQTLTICPYSLKEGAFLI